MRVVFVASLVVAVIVSGVCIRRSQLSRAGRGDVAAERADDLQRQVDALRARIGSVEAVNGAAFAKAVSATSSAPVAEEREPNNVQHRAEILPPQPTQAQMLASFNSFFDELDNLRGSGSDVAMTEKFLTVLSKGEWRDGAKSSPIARAVSCGNGFCRVSLTFEDVAEAGAARMRLVLSLGPLSTEQSVFLDPEKRRVEGYFATGDKAFPPFPGT
jgi:hypothetical protein